MSAMQCRGGAVRVCSQSRIRPARKVRFDPSRIEQNSPHESAGESTDRELDLRCGGDAQAPKEVRVSGSVGFLAPTSQYESAPDLRADEKGQDRRAGAREFPEPTLLDLCRS